VLGTILSRAQTLVFPPLSQQVIRQTLIGKYDLTEGEADELSVLCNGNLSEAIKLHKSGFEGHAETFITWMRLCYNLKADDFYKTINELGSKGREQLKDFFRYAIRISRELFLYSKRFDEINQLAPSEKSFAENLSKFINASNINEIYDLLNKAHYHIERNANPKILMFNLSLQLHRILKRE
jgi:DNA polymerase III subunit delta'